MKFALCFLLALCGNALSGHVSFGPSVLRVVQPNHFLNPSFFSSPPTQEFTFQLNNPGPKSQGKSNSNQVIEIPSSGPGSGPITIRLVFPPKGGSSENESPSDDFGDSNDIDVPVSIEDNDDQNGAIEINDDSQNGPEDVDEPSVTRLAQNVPRPSGRNTNNNNRNTNRPAPSRSNANNRAVPSRSNANNRAVPSQSTANNQGRSSLGGPSTEFRDISIIRAVDLGGFQLESRDRNPNPGFRGSNSQNNISPNVDEGDDIENDSPATPPQRSSGGNSNRGRSQIPNNVRQRVSPNSNRSNSGNTNTPRRTNNNQAPNRGQGTPSRNANRQNSPSNSLRPNTIQFQFIQPSTIINDPAFLAPPLIRFLSPQ